MKTQAPRLSTVLWSLVACAMAVMPVQVHAGDGVPPVPVAVLHVDTFHEVCVRGVPINSDRLQMSLKRMKAGGVRLAGAAIWIPPEVAKSPAGALGHVERVAKCIREVAAAHPAELAVALTPDEAIALGAAGKIALVITVEGGEPALAGEDAIERMHSMGVRAMSLTWSRDNALASSHTTSGDQGLTEQGRRAVRRMNRAGMMLDISHASPRAAAEILELSSVPVYASHSNCRALRNDPRNIDDGLLAALGRRGGVVGVSFHVPHVKKGGASIKDVAAHMARIEAVAGPWTAAVGADYDGRIRTASGLDDASLLQALPGALAAAGFSDAGIAGAMYKNFLDYWKRTEGEKDGDARKEQKAAR